jgi:hypothetical protein
MTYFVLVVINSKLQFYICEIRLTKYLSMGMLFPLQDLHHRSRVVKVTRIAYVEARNLEVLKVSKIKNYQNTFDI